MTLASRRLLIRARNRWWQLPAVLALAAGMLVWLDWLAAP